MVKRTPPNTGSVYHLANEYMAHLTDRLSVQEAGNETITFSVRCQPWLAERLRLMAETLGVSRNVLVVDLLRGAMDDFIEELKQECRDNGVEDALAPLLEAMEAEGRR